MAEQKLDFTEALRKVEETFRILTPVITVSGDYLNITHGGASFQIPLAKTTNIKSGFTK